MQQGDKGTHGQVVATADKPEPRPLAKRLIERVARQLSEHKERGVSGIRVALFGGAGQGHCE